MATHISILPLDILHSLSATLEVTGLCFLRLPHPRTGVPSLFLPCETSDPAQSSSQTRILEVQAVSPPDSRSWLMGDEVMADGKLLIITAIDPVFLLIPILRAAYQDDGTPGKFRPADDIFETASLQLQESSQSHQDQSLHILSTDVTQLVSLNCVKEALKRICDFKEITQEIVVYRFSPTKALSYLQNKVARLSTPHNMEISRTLVRGLAKDGLMEDGKDKILKAGRIRASCDLLGQYLSTDMRATLIASYNFKDLDAYFKTIENEAASLAVDTKTIAKGRQSNKLANGEEKKRKGTKTSQGVEKLKKVNVNGMAKLSSFFKKS